MAEVVFDIAQAGDQTHQAFRDMRVEIVDDHAPLRGRRAGGEQGVQKVGVVPLSAGLTDAGGPLAVRQVESRNHRLRAMADVFELPSGDLARLNWQVRGGALQRLHAGHFVDRHRANVLLRRRGRLMIERANLGAFALELRVRRGREPAAYEMRLEVGLFLKSARPTRARCFRRCRV